MVNLCNQPKFGYIFMHLMYPASSLKVMKAHLAYFVFFPDRRFSSISSIFSQACSNLFLSTAIFVSVVNCFLFVYKSNFFSRAISFSNLSNDFAIVPRIFLHLIMLPLFMAKLMSTMERSSTGFSGTGCFFLSARLTTLACSSSKSACKTRLKCSMKSARSFSTLSCFGKNCMNMV